MGRQKNQPNRKMWRGNGIRANMICTFLLKCHEKYLDKPWDFFFKSLYVPSKQNHLKIRATQSRPKREDIGMGLERSQNPHSLRHEGRITPPPSTVTVAEGRYGFISVPTVGVSRSKSVCFDKEETLAPEKPLHTKVFEQQKGSRTNTLIP